MMTTLEKKRKAQERKKERPSKKRTKRPRFYISVTGEKVSKPRKTPYIYVEKKTLDWLLCSILHDFPKIPVSYNGRIFDEDALRRWFWTSLVDPFTGVKVHTVNAIRIPIWRYLLLCLAESKSPQYKETHLVFYQRRSTYALAELLGQLSLPDVVRPKHPDYDKRESWSMKFPATHKCVSLSLLQPLVTQHIPIETIHLLSMEELLNCPITKLPVNCYSQKGHVLHWLPLPRDGVKLWKLNGISLQSFDEWANQKWFQLRSKENKEVRLSPAVIEWMKNPTELTSLDDIGKTSEVRRLKLQELAPWFHLLPFELAYYGVKKAQTKAIGIRSPSEVVRERLQQIQSMNVSDGFKVLSQAWDGKFHGCGQGSSSSATLMRSSLGLPFLVDQSHNTYGEDFSFMTLKGSFYDIQLKDYQFAACDLRQTRWQNVEFSCCCFVDAQLHGAIFINCTFRECIGDLHNGCLISCTFQ